MNRPPAVAGTFYPTSPQELSEEINALINQTTHIEFPSPKAFIVPHAGYIYSGQVAAAGFALLKQKRPFPTTYFLIGPAHRSYTSATVSCYDSYETPLGTIPINNIIGNELLTSGLFKQDLAAEASEHCLEVQLPFLQTVADNFFIVPILCGDCDSKQIAQALSPYFLDPTNFFIISSDLSHYLPYETAKTCDNTTIKTILELDQTYENKIDACGKIPIEILLHLAKENNYTPTLIDYKNSGETAGTKD
ncbi:MAG: AmmeMemoRadiSam system protein B, partial [bacterium]